MFLNLHVKVFPVNSIKQMMFPGSLVLMRTTQLYRTLWQAGKVGYLIDSFCYIPGFDEQQPVFGYCQYNNLVALVLTGKHAIKCRHAHGFKRPLFRGMLGTIHIRIQPKKRVTQGCCIAG